jgi:hypothetical protein
VAAGPMAVSALGPQNQSWPRFLFAGRRWVVLRLSTPSLDEARAGLVRGLRRCVRFRGRLVESRSHLAEVGDTVATVRLGLVERLVGDPQEAEPLERLDGSRGDAD